MWRPDTTYIEELANRLAVGFNIANIGPKVKYIDVQQADPLPTILRIGTSYKVIKDEYNDLREQDGELYHSNSMSVSSLVKSYPPVLAQVS